MGRYMYYFQSDAQCPTGQKSVGRESKGGGAEKERGSPATEILGTARRERTDRAPAPRSWC